MSELDHDGDAVIEMDLLPPRWLDIQDEISQYLSDVAGNMKKLDTLHAKHILPGFDDESVKAREEREIEILTSDITKNFGASQRAIKRIDRMLRDQPAGQTAAEETMARNLQIALASRVGEVSTLFRKKQSAYLKKLRSLGGMSSPFDRARSPAAQNPYNDPAIFEEEADRSSAQTTLQQTAQVRRRAGVMDSAIDQREREIEKIAQGVIDLSNIFQELNSMVIDQGSLLDRIDYNVERTAEHVKGADKELTVATGYQKKSTKRKIILLLVLLVVGMFILVLVKPRKNSNEAPAKPDDRTDQGPKTVILNSVSGTGHAPARRRRAEWKQRRRRWTGDSGSAFMIP